METPQTRLTGARAGIVEGLGFDPCRISEAVRVQQPEHPQLLAAEHYVIGTCQKAWNLLESAETKNALCRDIGPTNIGGGSSRRATKAGVSPHPHVGRTV